MKAFQTLDCTVTTDWITGTHMHTQYSLLVTFIPIELFLFHFFYYNIFHNITKKNNNHRLSQLGVFRRSGEEVRGGGGAKTSHHDSTTKRSPTPSALPGQLQVHDL